MVLVAGALLAAGLLASLVAGRLRVPSLLLFLGVGMLAGSDGFGWISWSSDRKTHNNTTATATAIGSE